MDNWQPIETAPKDGRLVLSFFKGCPVFVAWVGLDGPTTVTTTGKWWWKKVHESEPEKETGWRLLMMGRKLDYGIHGNYGPIELTHWIPFPETYTEGEKDE